MNFNNWNNHLERIKNFYDSDIYEICCQDENIVSELFYGYIQAIGEDLVCDAVAQIYYGENSDFYIDYLIEDFIKFGQAIIPNYADTFEPLPMNPEIEAKLDYQHGIPLNTKEELFNFITLGKIPKKESIYISPDYAIRRSHDL